MKVSVIIPVYNVEKYLSRCLESVINQTYKNIEIILVNDGSTDNSVQIIGQYKDSRIKVINKVNGGLSSARNAGLKICTGDYITFVDSDDWIELDMVEFMMKQVCNTSCEIVVIKEIITYGENIILANPGKITNQLFSNNECMSQLCSTRIPSFTWGKLYKKELWDNIFFPEGYNYEDIATSYQIFNKCKLLVVSSYIGYNYYMREDSIVHTKNIKEVNSILHHIIQMRKNNISNNFWGFYQLKLLYGALVYAKRLPISIRNTKEYTNILASIKFLKKNIKLENPLLYYLKSPSFYKVAFLKLNLTFLSTLKQ